jgi:preprotein translocase subunit YajC
MSVVFEWVGANALLIFAIAAFACFVALFYLVMRRAQKHRSAAAKPEA